MSEGIENIVVAEKSPKTRAEELIASLTRDKAINELFGDAFERQYTIYGKSPREWRKEFRITIPENPDPAQCKVVVSKLAALIQDATFFYAAAEAQLAALTSGGDREYNNSFNKVVAEYRSKNKSLPAAQSLATMAESHILDIRGAIQNAKIIKNFWKTILEGLSEVRKNLELATWNNSTQVKQDGNIPAYKPNKGEYGNQTQGQVSNDDWDV